MKTKDLLEETLNSINNLIQRNKKIGQYAEFSPKNYVLDQVRLDIKDNRIIKFPIIILPLTKPIDVIFCYLGLNLYS